MNLKDFLASGGGKDGEFYWALVIEPGWIQAGIWQIIAEKAEIVSVSPPAAWETDEELIGAADTALSAAIQTLPEDVSEPQKTVFGVPPSWVSEGQIKKEHLDVIRKICADLSLEPSGFVVLPEAIAHYYKSQEGSPLNAVILGVGSENLELTVFRLGNLSGNSVIARSVSISDDVIEGLARFASREPLPSRILIYDGKGGELEDVRLALLDTSWDEHENTKFLHTPKIEVVDPNKKVLATALAGASEIADVFQIETIKKGYKEEGAAPEGQNLSEPEEKVSAKDLGFVIGEDVAEEKPQEISPVEEKPFFQKASPIGFLEKIKLTAAGIPGAPTKRVWSVGLIVLALVLVLGFVYWWFFPKAVVTVYVAPRRLEEEITLIVDAAADSPDFSERVLPGEVIETEISGDRTKSTSGTKTVGERAKATVEIRNSTPSIITLPAGTVLISGNNLEFTTDKAASVSAGFDTENPGKAPVDVTARNIGAEYNLAKDESFKVSNYPKVEVDAKATSDFSGGSSRDISAVSEEDADTLEEDLTEELIEKAKDELAATVPSDKFFIEDVIIAEATSKAFSNKVGDEASSLKLTLTLSAKGIVVTKQQLFDLAREDLKDKVSSGFVLRDEQLSAEFGLTDESGSEFELEGLFVANLLPEVKPDELAEKIKGKYPPLAESYLTSIPGFSRAEIKLKPRFPGKLGTLPRLSKNITIEVSAER
ncbi:baseplate J/gp47 family protein [Candidatus Woesebacteria bacterium]|nr:baseplate J/gp47 family protein [Candidatus Woesebacteria bacterium]